MNKYIDFTYNLLRTNTVTSREEAISKTIEEFNLQGFEKIALTWSIV